MGPPPTNSPARHPGGKRHHLNLYSDLAAPTIHRFLNARNATALQVDFLLTYASNNIYLPASFCQALLEGNIMAIPDPDATMDLSPLLTPPSPAGPANNVLIHVECTPTNTFLDSAMKA